MLLNSSENEKLFAKSVPVSLKDIHTNQSRTSQLFLTMEWQDASAGMYSRKVLAISLTDNNDPFFLYNLHLSEEDFQMLKANQDLLINFASFPQHIIDYIEMCLLEQKNPQPKFLLVFTINEKLGNVASPSQFDIIETNQFKHLTHLSLKFVAATESAVRQYLASCFRNLKEEKRQLQNNLSFLEQDLKDKLATCQHALNSKTQELELVRKELNVELTMKDSKHALELQEERNRFLSRQKEEESKFERERKEKEHNFRKQIQQLESRVNALDTLNKELHDKNYKHDSTIRDLRSNVFSLEEEIKRLKDSVQSYRLKCDHLHSEARDRQSHINHLDEIVKSLQHELLNKEQSITKLKEQIEIEIRQKKSFEMELENVRLELSMSEKSRKVKEQEKEELNEVILGLQDKAKMLKTKSELAAKYKQTIEEKEKILQDVKKEVAELDIKLKAKDAEIKTLTDSMNFLQRKVDGLEKELKTRENVIKWLNKQLTDNCVVPQYTPPSNLVLSPSDVAQKQLARISSAGQKSPSPDNSPSVITSNKITSKSVRLETPSPVYRKSSSTPFRVHNTEAADSAYCTFPSDYCNHVTPDNVCCNHNTNFEIDHEAMNAAFGSGDHIVKHSTAKKPTKPVKSTIPKVSKKR